MANWDVLSQSPRPFTHLLGSFLSTYDGTRPHAFPNLENCDELLMASDYSGEHKAADFCVYSFFLTTRTSILAMWHEHRLAWRREFLTENRTIAFKKLSDRQLQRALPTFLASAASVNGLVVSFAVEKSLDSSTFDLAWSPPYDVKTNVAAKVAKIASLGSYLAVALGDRRQTLSWITDDDAIVVDDKTTFFTTQTIAALLHEFGDYKPRNVRFGVASKFNDGLLAEDLCAIPDLAAGAIAELLTRHNGALPRTEPIVTMPASPLSTKSQLITAWLALPMPRLKSLVVAIRSGLDGGIQLQLANPTILSDQETPRRLRLPADKGWRNSLRRR
jgi:hypothetical protein